MFELPPPSDDGLYIPEPVGSWSADKHHFLRRYIDAFTTAMKAKRWAGLHYIDLFAGAGIENIDNERLEWGSPLIAAQCPTQFSQLHLSEINGDRFNALKARLAAFPQPLPPQLIQGDANQVVREVVHAIPEGSLSLAFLDPYGLHLHYRTLEQLASRRADLIIFFPDHMDALRNWAGVYSEQPDSNLDMVLGHVPWRELRTASPPDKWSAILSNLYVDQIKKLGYSYFDYERITKPDGRFLYKLIFCSKNAAGGKIWRGIAGKKRSGQDSFNFDR